MTAGAVRIWIPPYHESWWENGHAVSRDVTGHYDEGQPSMPNRSKSRASLARRPAPTQAPRRAELAALKKAHRVEKQIQRLARALDREMQRTNDRLQTLAVALSSRKRAIEAERDVDRSLAHG